MSEGRDGFSQCIGVHLMPHPSMYPYSRRSGHSRSRHASIQVGRGRVDRDEGVTDMAHAIRSGRAHRPNGASALHLLEVMSAFERSSDRARFIEKESHSKEGRDDPKIHR